MSTPKSELTFTAPGPGGWELDANHFPRPVPRCYAEVFPEAMRAGLQPTTARYGLVLDYVEFGFVHGFGYLAPRPVGAPKAANGPPPKLIFKALLALHPELKRRLRSAETLFDRKPWRDDLARWDAEVKPGAIALHRALGAEDPAGLDRPGLLAHLERARAHMVAMVAQHHSFDAAAFLPIGDLLVQASAWTGLSHGQVLCALRGAAPVSAGESPELTRLVRALDADAKGVARLKASDAPSEIIAALRSWPGAVGEAFSAWLELVGSRLVEGLDPSGRTLAESPELMVKSLRGQLDRGGRGANASEADVARVRDRVPAAQRPAFDALLAEARHVSRLRDERALYSDTWATGLFRRAALVAGRLLVREGRIETAEHLLHTNWGELRTLLADGAGPGGAELAARASELSSRSLADAPRQLAGGPSAPPPLSWLPTNAARALAAILTFVDGMTHGLAVPAQATREMARGLAVSTGRYEGTARLIRHAADFSRLEHGDVLVTASTSPTFNVVLPLVGAIVTDRGGLLSHAALVAREYGIPAVVGCGDATHRIPDGARVRVDGDAGEATVLS